MSASDSTNGLVFKLMAVASDVKGVEGQELMSLLSKLTKAAQAERTQGESLQAQIKTLKSDVEDWKDRVKTLEQQLTHALATKREVAPSTEQQSEGEDGTLKQEPEQNEFLGYCVDFPWVSPPDPNFDSTSGRVTMDDLKKLRHPHSLLRTPTHEAERPLVAHSAPPVEVAGMNGDTTELESPLSPPTVSSFEQSGLPYASSGLNFASSYYNKKRPAPAQPELQAPKRPRYDPSPGSVLRSSKPVCNHCRYQKLICEPGTPCTGCRLANRTRFQCSYFWCGSGNICKDRHCKRFHPDEMSVYDVRMRSITQAPGRTR